MKMFLDSAITDEIKHALEVWDLDGLTTNPRHIKNSGKPRLSVLEEIAGLFAGTDKPVSVEVNPHLTETGPIVAEALQQRLDGRVEAGRFFGFMSYIGLRAERI